jgi:hypothetical protein
MSVDISDVLEVSGGFDAIRPDTVGYPVKPSHIDVRRYPTGYDIAVKLFGSEQNVLTALAVVRFCQVNDAWGTLKLHKFRAFCFDKEIATGSLNDLFKAGLLHGAGYEAYDVTHAFVSICWMILPPAHLG